VYLSLSAILLSLSSSFLLRLDIGEIIHRSAAVTVILRDGDPIGRRAGKTARYLGFFGSQDPVGFRSPAMRRPSNATDPVDQCWRGLLLALRLLV